jgi:hypothetical protein
MNKFYHYGDSFATCDDSETIFSKYIAKDMGLKFVGRASSGKSNLSILSNILQDLPTLNSGDKVLIGFTFFTRGEYVDRDDKLVSTNIYYNDMDGTKIDNLEHQKSIGIDIMDIKRRNNTLEYWVDYSWDAYVKTFKYLINPTFTYLKDKGIDIKYFYIKKDFLTLDGEQKEYVNFLPKGEIMFDTNSDFISYLVSNDWLREESVHYKWGIQNSLADVFIKNWKVNVL